jgi:hypothetical protein
LAGLRAAELEKAVRFWETATGWLWDLARWFSWPEQLWLRCIWVIALFIDLAALAAICLPGFREWLITSPELPSAVDGEGAENGVTKQKEAPDLRTFWQAGVTFLTGLIPVVTLFGPRDTENAPLLATGSTLVLVVMAVTVVQLYGQQRNITERANQTTAIRGITAAIRGITATTNRLATALLENEEKAEASEPDQDEPRSSIPGITEGDERLGEVVAPATSSPIEEEEEENSLIGWQFIEPLEIEQFYNDWLAFEFRKCHSSAERFSAILDQINYIGKPFFLNALRISSWQSSQYAYQFGATEASDYLIEMGITQEWINNWIDSLLCDENAKRLLPENSGIFGVVKDCLEFGVYQGAFHGLKLRKGLKGTARDGYPFRIPGCGGVGRI